MSVNEASQRRYSAEVIHAAYLEAEWSDFFLPTLEKGLSTDSMNPLTCRVRPDFYRNVASRLAQRLELQGLSPLRYCDVGGATGRMLYETMLAVPSLAELTLCEPSSLAIWAEKILLSSEDSWLIPVVDGIRTCARSRIRSRPDMAPFVNKKILVSNEPVESLRQSEGYFEIVSCLNVVDRVSNPAAFVSHLVSLVSDNGCLVLASPLQFDSRFTQNEDLWVDDLKDLLSGHAFTVLDEFFLRYEFHRNRREWIRYDSQVLILSQTQSRWQESHVGDTGVGESVRGIAGLR